MTLDELIAKYRSSSGGMTEREKAEVEKEVWELHRREMGVPVTAGARREALKKLLDADQYSSSHRYTLLNAGSAGDPLWDLVHKKKLLMRAACEIVRDARKICGPGMPMSEAVGKALHMYESRPHVRHLNGIPYRTRIIGESPESQRRVEKTAEAKLWGSIKSQITHYLDERTPNLDPLVRKKFATETSVALRVVADEFRNKLRRLVESHDTKKDADALMKMDEVDKACQFFGVDTPAFGRPVDLDKANKAKKAMARSLHPDLHGGDKRHLDQYHEVMAAYEVLEKYNSQIKPIGETAKHDHTGRTDRRSSRDS